MMGIPIDGATHIYWDCMSVMKNNSKQESILNKNKNTMCYHTARGPVAMGESLTRHQDCNANPADLLMKVLCGDKRTYLVNTILHDVYNGEFKQLYLHPVKVPMLLEGNRTNTAENIE